MEDLFEIKAALAAGDYIDEEGYLCCGNCNTRKQYRTPGHYLMGKVPRVNVSFRFLASVSRRKTPKTDAGTRDIPMTPEVEQCFKNLIKKRERMTVEPIVGGKAGFLYLDKYKRPVVALHWEHYFRGMISAYDRSHNIPLPKITPHNCRHTFSTKMSRMRMYPKDLQYIMGHSDYKVTMNTYTHLAFEDARR